MATTRDLLQLEERLRAELRTGLADLRSELSWQMIAIVGFFAAVTTLVNEIVG